MADKEHLRILQRGVDAWNEWRESNPNIVPDLSKADLREANLFSANLKGAYLRNTDLWKAYLSNARLRKADLSEAHLRQANLMGQTSGGLTFGVLTSVQSTYDGRTSWERTLLELSWAIRTSGMSI